MWWFFIGSIIFAFLCVIFKFILKTKIFPKMIGKAGENLVASLLDQLENSTYKIFYNLILPDNNGTTQIDYIITSQYGVFVLEVKTYAGSIYGKEKEPKWTQVLGYRFKYTFQNPLRQNYRHIKALSQILNLPEGFFHSVIFFAGKSKFMTKMPENVLEEKEGLVKFIKKYKEILLTTEKLNEINNTLNNLKTNPIITEKKHIKNLKKQTKKVKNGLR